MPGGAADHERGGAVLDRDRFAPVAELRHEHDRPGGSVDLLAGDGEARPAGDHDVELLVRARARARLVVPLDQLLARVGGVAVDPECAHTEDAPDRPPVDAGDVDAVELVDAGHAGCHEAGS